MKRIEDKIKEIEKKDKTNRRLYIGVVVLIALFMVSSLYFGREISKRDKTIAKSEVTISGQKVEQTETYKKLDASFKALQNSLQPKEYWNHIKKENSVEAYINYITNNWGIEKTKYLPKAIENLESPKAIGFQGWLYVGSKTKDEKYTSGNRVEIVYRVNEKGDIKNSEIRKGDIVKLITKENRRTYKYKTLKRKGKNMNGWRNKTKGFVTDVWKDPNSADFIIEIKYY